MAMVSVVIPTHNRKAYVKECVLSLLKSTWQDFDVWVVDDASTDGTSDMIQKDLSFDARVHTMRNETSQSLATTRNRGARASQGEYIFFMDDDNVVEETALERLLAYARRRPDTGMIAPLALNTVVGGGDVSATIWTLGATFNWITSRALNLYADKRLDEVENLQEAYPTWYSPNAFMVSRTAYEAVGGCDDFYGIMFDDSDFGLRIYRKGYPCVILSGARVFHRHGVTTQQNAVLRRYGIESPRRAYLFARNRMVFVRRFAPWYGKVSVVCVFAPLLTVFYCALAIRHGEWRCAFGYLRGWLAGMGYMAGIR